MKHTYHLMLNRGKPVTTPVISSYGNNHGIELHILKPGILIRVRSSAEKTAEDILSGKDYLFADAMRKSLLLYLIRYGRNLPVTHAVVTVDDEETGSYVKTAGSDPLVYSLAEGTLKIPFSAEWKNPSFESALAVRSKAINRRLMIALYSLVTAKTDRYEAERLLYYWIAVNGLYNYVADLKNHDLGKDAYRRYMRKDHKKQKDLLTSAGYDIFSSSTNDKLRDELDAKLKRAAGSIIKRIRPDEIEDFCEACLQEDTGNQYVKEISELIMKSVDVPNPSHADGMIFPFMVIWLPYKMRCDLFHADQCLPIICFRDDKELNVIRVINRLLDRFLTHELLKWFIGDNVSIELKDARNGTMKK